MAAPGDSADKQDTKRRALGRGLEALLPSRHTTGTAQISASEAGGVPLEIDLDKIDRNPFQTRSNFDEFKLTELANSIAATGVVQPIVVRAIEGGRYQLITGERRLLASRQAKKTTIPAVLRSVSDEQAMEMTIVENLQRADLNPIEQAKAFQRLATDFRMTQEQMAIRTGKERASVGNFLRLLRLPESVRLKVETGEISFGHARALLSLPNAEAVESAAQKILALSLSVRQTETYVQGILNPDSKVVRPQKVIEPQDPNVVEAQQSLQRSLGLRVRIEDRQGRGRVIIEYSDLQDFDALLHILSPLQN